MTSTASQLVVMERDRELLEALVQKVRLFSLRQIAGHWWGDEVANARRRLSRLALAGLVLKTAVQARPVPQLQRPVIHWQPNDPTPHFGQAAHRLQSRWRSRPLRACTAYVATQHASQLYGGKARGELKHPTQATHDLGVAAVWLRYHEDAPELAAAWRSEDLMAHTRRGEKLPDGFIFNGNGETVSVIEFGGSYDAERVRAFHEDCAYRQLPYQMW